MKVSMFGMAPQLAHVLPHTTTMVLACIDVAVASHLGAMNEMPEEAAAAIRAGSRHRMTDRSGAVVTCWRFTCTSPQAMVIRVELCAAAFAARASNPNWSAELLRAEHDIARAMAEDRHDP